MPPVAPPSFLAFAVFLLASAGFALGQSPSVPAKTTEQAFKNIQVLKNLPEYQLIPAMQFVSASLGVGCDFCHVQGKFDQDDKKTKLTARKMMQMVAAINQSNFDGRREVTCNTCHAGAVHPVSIPVISDSGPKPPMPEAPPSANLPTADQLLDKYVKALGGEKAITAVTSRVIEGTATFFGHDVAVEIFNRAGKGVGQVKAGQRLSLMRMSNGDSVTAFDGHEGWLASPGRPLMEMHGGELDAARMDADLQFALHLKQNYNELKPDQAEKIAGHDAYQLVASNPNQPPLRLYFDRESGLLLRLVRYADSPLGLNPTRIDFEGYSAVDGVQVPHRWTIARPSGQFTIEAKEIRQNVPVSDDKFVKPATSPPPPAP
jgi:photosynthetic reaction center cytochrome c subunit